MISMFPASNLKEDLALIDELLEGVRLFRKDLSESDSNRFKFNNNTSGTPEVKQKAIEKIVFRLNGGEYDRLDTESKLKIIDLLTLYSNHLDQQTSGKVNPILPIPIKEKTVLRWLEAAYTLGTTLVPNLDKVLTNKVELLMLPDDILSSFSLMFHYLGKARRYDKENRIETKDRLPLLTAALDIGKYLEQADDIHNYRGRVPTFEMPVVYTLRDLGRYKEAYRIIDTQLKKSYESKNLFHIIQGHNQLSEIAREQFEADDTGIEESIMHAETAIKCVKENTKEEDFTENPIYFNARVAAMKAYACKGDKKQASSMAEDILSEHASNKNCGAKQAHIDAAEAMLSNLSTLGFQA